MHLGPPHPSSGHDDVSRLSESKRPFDVDDRWRGRTAYLVWLGRAVTAVQPILVRRAQVVFSRPFQGHLELYREMLQLPAVRWDHPHQKSLLGWR